MVCLPKLCNPESPPGLWIWYSSVNCHRFMQRTQPGLQVVSLDKPRGSKFTRPIKENVLNVLVSTTSFTTVSSGELSILR